MLFSILLALLAVHCIQGNDRIVGRSLLDFVEINDYRYNIEIAKEIKLDSRFKSSDLEIDKDVTLVRVKNVHGQFYECSLPRFDELPNDDDLNKNEPNGVSYNFTLVNELVRKAAEGLVKSNICIYRSLGWWTYEFCFGSHVSQYHLLNNGSIAGEIINLGNFTSDYNWLIANENALNFPVSSGILFHEQYYELGTTCELTGVPRRVVAKIFCDEQSETEIDLISEVESCIYEIHINSHSLCSIPYFSKKQNKFDIKCHPVVDHTTYADYLKKKESLKGVERRAIRKETLNDVKEEASVTLSSTEPSVVKDLNYEELIEMVSNDQDLYDKTVETLNLDAEDLQGFNYEILNHNKELYRQLKEGGANPEELKTISDWLDKFERILDTNEKALDKESNLESEIMDENVKEMEEALQSDHTDLDAQDLKGLNYQILNHNKELYRQLKEGGANPEELKTISDWLDKFERILDTTEKALDKESEITDEILKESDHPIQDLMNQIENQDLEKRNLKTKVDSSPKEVDLNDVVDQLKDKNQQLADLKNLDLNKIRTSFGLDKSNQKVKIKIIKLNDNDVQLDPEELNQMLNSMLKEKDEIDKFQTLTDNYNYVYDSNKELEEEDADVGLLSTKNTNTIIIDNMEIQQEQWDTYKKQKDKKGEEEDKDNLIIFR